MRFYHYSDDADLGTLRDARQPPDSEWLGKPSGLWVSDEDNDPEGSWSTWCRNEHWGDIDEKHRHTIEVDVRRVLRITTSAELMNFNRKYSRDMKIGHASNRSPNYRRTVISWTLVAERYDGIIISPYQWRHRMDHDMSWYYGWDCASGCIWNASAMEVVRDRATH